MSPFQFARLLVAFMVLLGWHDSVVAQDAKPKPAVPDAAARKEASSTIAEVYEKEFRQATRSEQKRTLAQKMIDDGLKTKNDPAIRHELFRMAQDIAISIGDANLAIKSV